MSEIEEMAQQAQFDADLDFLFETLLDHYENGKISAEQVERFFPEEVKIDLSPRLRNAIENSEK